MNIPYSISHVQYPSYDARYQWVVAVPFSGVCTVSNALLASYIADATLWCFHSVPRRYSLVVCVVSIVVVACRVSNSLSSFTLCVSAVCRFHREAYQ